jgi:hypothetical protein
VEFLTSIAVFAYFWRDRRGMSAWRVLVCPAVVAAMLAVVLVAIFSQIDILTARTGLVKLHPDGSSRGCCHHWHRAGALAAVAPSRRFTPSS